MGIFGNIKAKLAGASSKYSGRKDFLEAVCAGAALVASADGKVDDSEIDATIKAISANESLNSGFDNRTIEQVANRMIDRANGGRVGRNGLYKEIDDIAADKDMSEIVLLTALDIADADGNMDDKEKAVLENIAKRLGLSLASYA